MENKNNIVLFSLVFLIIGVLLGWVISLNNGYRVPNGMHMMGNGQMMNNGNMGMNDTMGSMMAGLEGKTGDKFDKAFLSEMIMHHEGAVVMAQAVLKTSKRPELLKLAKDIISAQSKEIDMMKGWQKEWFQ